MKKVEELEKTLFSLKMQANDLTIGIRNVEKELLELKNERANYQRPVNQQPVYQQPVNPQPVHQQFVYQQPVNPKPQQSAPAPQTYPQKQHTEMNKSKDSNTESWVGKILMGVLASLLVFIALITFAKLIMPYITDTVKVVLMFAASISLTVAGFVLSKKKPKNTFFSALLACGTACVYLSVIVTRVHFEAISSIVMYILLALWAGVVIILGRSRKDWLFFVIGNLGFLVSACFAGELDQQELIIPMLVYIVVIGAAYQLAFWKNVPQRYVQSTVNAIGLMILELSVLIGFKDVVEIHIVSFITIFYIFAQFLIYLLADLKDVKVSHFVLACINLLLLLIAYLSFAAEVKLPATATFAVLLVLGAILEASNILIRAKGMTGDENIISAIFAGLLFSIAAFMGADKGEMLFNYGIVLVIFALIAVYGAVRKDILFKNQGWVLSILCMVAGLSCESGVVFELVALSLSLIAFAYECFIENRSIPYKIISYLQMLFWIAVICHRASELEFLLIHGDELFFCAVFTLGVINAVLGFIGFCRTRETDRELPVRLTLDLINAAAILTCMSMLNDSEGLLKALYACALVIFACINLPVGKNATRYRILYAGIKFGILLFYILSVYKTPDFFISVCMIFFAVICIITGFWKKDKAKALRIFGLVLTMLFVVKFIIVDISFDSSVTKALSYLASGILCFGISAIYNHFEKQGKSGNQEQNAG